MQQLWQNLEAGLHIRKLAWNAPSQAPCSKDVPRTIEGLASLLAFIQQAAGAKKHTDVWAGLEEEAFVEVIRRVSELMVWGETHDPRFLDIFCERRILGDFVRLLVSDTATVAIKVQLLQTIAIIIPNVQSASALHYLLDGNLMNEIIMVDLDFDNDEILSWYISLLKSLSLRLNRVTVRLFHDSKSGAFPLLSNSMRFFSHNDLMVRSSVRCLILSILCVEGAEIERFIFEHFAAALFFKVSSSLCDVWAQISSLSGTGVRFVGFDALRGAENPTQESCEKASNHITEALSDALHEETELLEYVSDILSSVGRLLTDVLVGCLLYHAVLRLLSSLLDRTAASVTKPIANTHVALHALMGVTRTCGAYQQIVEPLAKALLSPTISTQLRDALLTGLSSPEAIETATLAWQTTQGSQNSLARWSASPDSSSSSTLVVNPFRAALLSFLRSSTDPRADGARNLLCHLRSAPELPASFQIEIDRLDDESNVSGSTVMTTTKLPVAAGVQNRREFGDTSTVSRYNSVGTRLESAVGDASPGPDAPIRLERQTVSKSQINPLRGIHETPEHLQVLLDCVQAVGVLVERLTLEQRLLDLRLHANGGMLHALVGRQHQPEFFDFFVPDDEKRMCISRTHFEFTWVGALMMRNLSANPLYVNGCVLETGAVVYIQTGDTISFKTVVDAHIFLTFSVKLRRWTSHISGQSCNDRSASFSNSQSGIAASAAARPVLVGLECMSATGIDLQELPVNARSVGMDLRHRTVLGRQHQPGFFENLLQGAPQLVTFVSRAHVLVTRPCHADEFVKIQNLSRNAIFVDGKLVPTGETCSALEGSVLGFTGESRPLYAEEAPRFLQFVIRSAEQV